MTEKWADRLKDNKSAITKVGIAAVAAGGAIGIAAVYERSLYQRLESEEDAVKFLERKLQPNHHTIMAICAQLATKGCLNAPRILREAELTPRSFVRAVGKIEEADVHHLLIRPIKVGDECLQQASATQSHYEPGSLLRDITDKGLGGDAYQELVAAAWPATGNS
jgi:hypothetical protein